MYDIEKTIKHFESLQKRYTTQHSNKMCERVADALEALYAYKKVQDKLVEELVNVKPIDACVGEIRYFKQTADKFDSII